MNQFACGLLLSLSTLLLSGLSFAQTRLENALDLRREYGLDAYSVRGTQADREKLKVAILDNGFMGFSAGRGLLPESAEVIEGPVNPQATVNHGFGMAMAMWGMTKWRAEGPKFYLVNANGFSNFKAAIDFVIENEIDIVLYAQNWTFGGNMDGTGFINAQVSRATDAGVFWINSAGNFGQQVYNGKIAKVRNSNLLRLPGARNTLRFSNDLDANPVQIALSWNDFSDDESVATSKDLDFYLYNTAGTLLHKAEKRQNGRAPVDVAEEATMSAYARESLSVTLDKGDYYVQIVQISDNFDAADELRFALSSQRFGSLKFTDASDSGEIFPPADHPDVFTVGDLSDISALGPTRSGLRKPDLSLREGRLKFSDGQETFGSSNAAAIFAGILIEMKSYYPQLEPAHLRAYLDSLQPESETVGPQWQTPAPRTLLRFIR